MSVIVERKNSVFDENNNDSKTSRGSSCVPNSNVMNFLGTYKHEKDDNFEEFMKVIDVPYFGRKLVAACKPIMTINFIEGGYIRITCNHFKVFNYCIDFKEGEEFEEHLFSGESVRKIIQTEKNKWIETQLTGKHSGVTFIREIKEDGLLKVTCQHNGVTGYRYFRKQ